MLNRVCIMGRLVEDVNLRTVGGENEISVGSFRLAVDRDYKDREGKRPADFFNVTVWRGLAEFTARNLHKGDLVGVDGRLELQQWTDKEGNKRQGVIIKAEDVYFGSKKKFQPEDAEPWANGDPNELLPPPEGWGEPEIPPDNDNLPF